MKRRICLRQFSAKFLLFVIAILGQDANAQLSGNQPATKNWVGTYEFFDGEKDGPRKQPGNFVTYTLTLSLNGDSRSARFTADGTQTSDEYECRAQSSASSIKIFFESDLNGMNKSRFKPFKKGELLFTLAKTQTGKKLKYLYRAGGYEILPLSSSSKKIYFERKSE